jgi:heme oxygenase
VFEEHRDLDIQRLRQETEVDHQAVEGAVPLMQEGLHTEQYVQCLLRIYGVVAAWEDRAAQVAPQWLRPALTARQRKPLLELDLAWFGVTKHDESRPALPEMNDLASLFGTMYVMEGSTLGGQFIARHVETFSPGPPTRHLNLSLSAPSGTRQQHKCDPLWERAISASV